MDARDARADAAGSMRTRLRLMGARPKTKARAVVDGSTRIPHWTMAAQYAAGTSSILTLTQDRKGKQVFAYQRLTGRKSALGQLRTLAKEVLYFAKGEEQEQAAAFSL